jgi:2'-5' RNA ligase
MAERSELLRLFVACELSDEVRRALGRVQDDLRRLGARPLRWVRPEGIHVTLKFLGETESRRVDDIVEALAGAIPPFELSLRVSTLGGFGGARLRVVWVGLEGDVEALAGVARRVDGALAPLGFPRERRPFAAHLTLARVRDEASPAERRELVALIQRYRMPAPPSMIVREVALMRSIVGSGGSVYRRLASFPSGAGVAS